MAFRGKGFTVYQVGPDSYEVIANRHKFRKENEYYIVFFSDLGEYYAANEVGIDILEFFFQTEETELFAYLESLYGQLNETQCQAISNYVQKLCMMNIIEKRNPHEEI